jgi:Na+/melibiose symporter-like transporter
VRRSQQLAYLGCSFSIGIFSAFNNFTLTLWLSSLTSSYLLLGLMGNTRSFEGSLVGPAVGMVSDRVWLGWLGRRRPFILAGGLASVLLVAITPAFSRMPEQVVRLTTTRRELILAVVVIVLFTLTFSAMTDMNDALLLDITAEEERNRLSAIRILVNTSGSVAILVLGFFFWRTSVPDSAFVIVGALLAAGVLTTVICVREPPPEVWSAGAGRESQISGWALLRRYRSAAILCLVAFCYWSGVNAVMPLVSIYIKNILHATVGESQLLPAFLLLSTTLCALPAAKLGSRYGKREVIGAGYLIIAAISLAGLVITTKQQGAVVLLIAGVGNAGSQVLMIPLLGDLVSRRHVGAAAGVLAGSGSIAAPAASLIAGHLSDLYGPRVIFLLMSVTVAIAFVLLQFVRVPSARLRSEDADTGPRLPSALTGS